MDDKLTILKNPTLLPAEDYWFLRQEGMKYIEELGSKFWTDYNIHDPGITLLEALSYAITDLGYRTSFDIKDLLANPAGQKADWSKQGFFTAREILTVNPWTTADFRKLLIDIVGVKNAWLFCKECPCDMFLYADCAKSKLQYSPVTEHTVVIKGMYDVLVEFEDDDNAGNLNSGKIKYNFSFVMGTGIQQKLVPATIEMRLPSWAKIEGEKAKFASFRNEESEVKEVKVKFISGNKGDNLNIPETELGKALRRPLFATVEVIFYPDKGNISVTETLLFEDVPFIVWFRGDEERKAIKLSDISDAMSDNTSSGIFGKYAEKIKKADEIMKVAKFSLHEHRNLAEDYCTVKAVEVEDVAVCADMDVTPDADIEKVLAQAYYLIDQYFSPDIRFYSLKELLDEGVPVDEIFEGPALENGFINNEQLESTQLKKVLYSSDIINLLMDIPGVVAIRNFVLVRYDEEGNRVQSEPWELFVTYNHQPRLYIEGTKFLVFKNGLPFLPDKFELWDTMQVIRGLNAQPSFQSAQNDLPVPEGEYYALQEYFPVQHSLPLTYGVGFEGLPPHANAERKAKAKQLKAYLLFFEQLLVNYLAQLANIKDLFAIDETVDSTYFSFLLKNGTVANIEDLYAPVDGNVLDELSLHKLDETEKTFLDRRNRFLDHMLARFSEQFGDYALMLYSYSTTKKQADEILVNDKIAFLKEYPFMSANRAKSFNYKDETMVCDSRNIAGLEKRIQRLLGYKSLENYLEVIEVLDGGGGIVEFTWQLSDEENNVLITGNINYSGTDKKLALAKAKEALEEVEKFIANPAAYEVKKNGKWAYYLKNSGGDVIGSNGGFSTKAKAEAARDAAIAFAKKIQSGEKIFIVEHLLLRPRNKPGVDFPEGDPLLPICIEGNCELCGEEDPYSFRITIVLNGEEGLANQGIEFRRFAEETIRLEVPAHLGVKICWVSNVQLEKFETLYCDWLSELAKTDPVPQDLHNKLKLLLKEFNLLKSVYPYATLHDCVDGNDENRVYLNQTII